VELRCKIEREGGTVVRIDETDYHFLPNNKGDHVCFVADKAHASRFLAVPEAYELYSKLESVESGGAAPPVIVQTRVDNDGQEVDPPNGADYNGFTRKQLIAAFKEKFNKNPSPKAKDETILKALTGG
jgi:hypothetical protein